VNIADSSTDTSVLWGVDGIYKVTTDAGRVVLTGLSEDARLEGPFQRGHWFYVSVAVYYTRVTLCIAEWGSETPICSEKTVGSDIVL
jgi:hypothetical protein